MATIRYPRRFTSGSKSPVMFSGPEGDEVVNVIFEDLMEGRGVDTWAFQERVIQTAIRLFGNAWNWINQQLSDPEIYGYSVSFIEDTLTYIETGERQMSPLTWLTLLSEGDSAGTAYSGKPKKVDGTTETLIKRWCQKPDGVNDLAATLYVLFGSSTQNH